MKAFVWQGDDDDNDIYNGDDNDDAEEYVWALNRQTMDATGQPGRPITICFASANIDDDESGLQFFLDFFL